MYSKVLSACVKGVSIEIVEVECDISSGLPVMEMVGLLASDVKEAKERVRTALKNINVFLPPKRITINMSPANVKKQGNEYDLPIAMAMVSALGIIDKEKLENVLVMGELSLDGRVNRVNGVLPVIVEAKKRGIKKFVVPRDNYSEGMIVNGIYLVGVSSILEAIEFVNSNTFIMNDNNPEELMANIYEDNTALKKDFFDVKGQESVKRAVMIAVAGMHNILMIGAPGSGKTMIAERIPYILPKPNFEECLEITKIQSITGNLKSDGLVTERPFRSPHHTISKIALLGGGSVPKAGEITMAHGGVLFLDELAEFKSETLDTLRQPLETGRVVINRTNGNYIFPANTMLVTATNPCKCGYYPDRNKCTCTEMNVKKYIGKISGPMLDRLDIWVYIPMVKLGEYNKGECMSTVEMVEKIEKARNIQQNRLKDCEERYNGKLKGQDIDRYCVLGDEEKAFLNNVYEKNTLSYRGYYKIIKVARTIADIEGSEKICVSHLAEAAGYRNVWR